jgi:GT2 family glycosyltransferase
MNDNSSVDVVIVSWKVREELLACLRSLAAEPRVQTRVVVVDNASGDGTVEAVARQSPKVTVLANQVNEGFARAANRGIAAGDAPYVLLLNPDTVVPPGALPALVAELERRPRHALVAPRLLGEDGSPQHSAYDFPSLWISLLLGSGAQRLLPRRLRARWLLEGDWDSDVERDVPWVIGACMLVRRSAIAAAGPFDERFFVYAEDMEWCDRLARAGYRIRFLPSVSVTHLGNRSGAQRFGEDRTAAWLANTVDFVRARHGRGWTAAYLLINGGATVSRYLGGALLVRLRPSPQRRERQRLWRGHARYYLGRSRTEKPPR